MNRGNKWLPYKYVTFRRPAGKLGFCLSVWIAKRWFAKPSQFIFISPRIDSQGQEIYGDMKALTIVLLGKGHQLLNTATFLQKKILAWIGGYHCLIWLAPSWRPSISFFGKKKVLGIVKIFNPGSANAVPAPTHIFSTKKICVWSNAHSLDVPNPTKKSAL